MQPRGELPPDAGSFGTGGGAAGAAARWEEVHLCVLLELLPVPSAASAAALAARSRAALTTRIRARRRAPPASALEFLGMGKAERWFRILLGDWGGGRKELWKDQQRQASRAPAIAASLRAPSQLGARAVV
jgi:hypothetical protein